MNDYSIFSAACFPDLSYFFSAVFPAYIQPDDLAFSQLKTFGCLLVIGFLILTTGCWIKLKKLRKKHPNAGFEKINFIECVFFSAASGLLFSSIIFPWLLGESIQFKLTSVPFAIGALLFFFFYVKNAKLRMALLNALSPLALLAYGITRLGCHLSGDGHWGKVNTIPIPEFFPFPDYFWKSTYPHNVLGQGPLIESYHWNYCFELPEAVYPTALWEAGFCIVFAIIIQFLSPSLKPKTFAISLTGVSLGRLTISFFNFHQVDFRLFSLTASTYQLLILLCFLVGISLLVFNASTLIFKNAFEE